MSANYHSSSFQLSGFRRSPVDAPARDLTTVDNTAAAVVTHRRQFLLAGDIGGTNTRMALYERKKGAADSTSYRRPLFAKDYRNEESLGAVLDDDDDDNSARFVRTILGPFLEEAWESRGGKVTTDRTTEGSNADDDDDAAAEIVCCLGVAGPVDSSSNNGTVTTSQRAYLKGVNGRGVLEACRTDDGSPAAAKTATTRARPLSRVKECVVINDFVAQGYGCLSLTVESGELERLDGNDRGDDDDAAGRPKFCVGAGTGFGSCYLVPTRPTGSSSEIGYGCFPSEYGQSDWAPPPDESVDDDDDSALLWKHLQGEEPSSETGTGTSRRRRRRVSVENVVSGIGLSAAFECVAGLNPAMADPAVRAAWDSERDLRGKIIGENAEFCKVCRRAVELVLRAYGSAVGSCAMAFLPTGGLYITGGLFRNLLKKTLGKVDGGGDGDGDGTDEISGTEREDYDDETPGVVPSDGSPPPSSSLLTVFLNAYRSKGAASFLLDDIPLYAVLSNDTGLRGAAVRAEQEFQAREAAAAAAPKIRWKDEFDDDDDNEDRYGDRYDDGSDDCRNFDYGNYY